VRFAQALMDGKIVKPDTLVQMWTPVKISGGGKGPDYGLGFGVLMVDGGKYVTHGGGQQGTSTSLAIIPERHFAVAMMANMEGAKLSEVAGGILDLYHMPHR
jgi:CubicO group peptidase (beta-lactamase class C family)